MRFAALVAMMSVSTAVACGSPTHDASPPLPSSSGSGQDASPPSESGDAGEVPSPDGSSDGALFDGEILLRGLIEGTAFVAFVRQTPFPMSAMTTLGDGHCDVHPRDQGDNPIASLRVDPSAAYVSLGPSVRITNASGTLTSTPLEGAAWYHGETTAFFSFGTDVTLATDGDTKGLPATSLGPFHVPSQVTPTPDSTDPRITVAGGPVRIHYGGGAGAQSFHIFITSKEHDIDCYPSPLSTDFELPPAVVGVLDSSFTPLVWAESRYEVSLSGKRVVVRVMSDNLD